jgi:glucan phosphoethanolaminetransferase (alkaline phosphatase superfamily)
MTLSTQSQQLSKTQSFFWLLSGIPLFMGSVYVLIYFFGFMKNIHFVGEHYLTVGFWTVNTALLTGTVYALSRRWGMKVATRLAMTVPALSYSFLFFIYLCALIGNFKWGSVTTYDVVWRFLGDLFNLDTATGIPTYIPFLALAIPVVAFATYFQWRGQDLLGGFHRLAERFRRQEPRRKRNILWAGTAAWAFVAVSLFSHNPHLKFFGHFRFDPVVGFFENSHFQFSLNSERMQAAEEDKAAIASLRRQVPRVRNVILIVVDALRADHLASYGYTRPINPYLSSLPGLPYFQKVDWALSTGTESATGQMSIMSSKETRDISHLVYSLPDNFHDNGYKTVLFYSGDSVWCNFENSFGKKIDSFIDGAEHPGPGGINDDQMLLDLIDQVQPDDGGFHFFSFHLMSAHEAGLLHDEYLRYKPVINLASYFFHPGAPQFEEERQGAVNMYDDRILQADSVIGKLMEKLREKGYLKDCLGVLTGDHGQRLGEQGEFGHGRYPTLATLRVPLLFFGSKRFPALYEHQFATTLDIAPTMVDLAGLDIPGSWQGQSLLRPRTRSWTFHLSPSTRTGNRGAVVYYDRGRILKYSRPLSPTGKGPDEEKVFELTSDPTEQKNLLQVIDPGLLQEMRRKAEEHFVVY